MDVEHANLPNVFGMREAGVLVRAAKTARLIIFRCDDTISDGVLLVEVRIDLRSGEA
jgi:hypothetical protein